MLSHPTVTTRYYLVAKQRWEGMKPLPYRAGSQFEDLWNIQRGILRMGRVSLPSAFMNGTDSVWAIHLTCGREDTRRILDCLGKGQYPLEQINNYNFVSKWLTFSCRRKKSKRKAEGQLQ